jgi:hypothetical protein
MPGSPPDDPLHGRRVRNVMGDGTLRCRVERVRFQHHFGYKDRYANRQDQKLVASYGISFHGKVERGGQNNLLARRIFNLYIQPSPDFAAAFRPDDDEPTLGAMWYHVNTEVGDYLDIRISAPPAMLATIETFANRIAANLSGYDVISVGVLDMAPEWVPADQAMLWVSSLEFESGFQISPDPKIDAN